MASPTDDVPAANVLVAMIVIDSAVATAVLVYTAVWCFRRRREAAARHSILASSLSSPDPAQLLGSPSVYDELF
jgi:hypothetical protein